MSDKEGDYEESFSSSSYTRTHGATVTKLPDAMPL